MDPMMPELERLFEHEQSELKRIGTCLGRLEDHLAR
jgi:hypothetical protein